MARNSDPSDPLVRLAIDVHLSTKLRFMDRCEKLNVTMASRARELLERDLATEDAERESAA